MWIYVYGRGQEKVVAPVPQPIDEPEGTKARANRAGSKAPIFKERIPMRQTDRLHAIMTFDAWESLGLPGEPGGLAMISFDRGAGLLEIRPLEPPVSPLGGLRINADQKPMLGYRP